ncbi:MAG: amidohydrolase [Deltaproteobacteria bacterium]|nr:amidohydrolase [Deltaproteobacteria bacterium]MDZ4347417.1 amidohydrolase [Candidatus Binatia bacterium]
MKTLIRNAVVVTMNEQNDLIDNGSVVIDGNRLSYVGPAEWTPPGPFDRMIDASRMIAMPGMVNAHCHSPANLVRGMMPSKPLEIWRAYYRASLRDMREEDFYASALLGGVEMLKAGATTVLDHFAGNQACRFMGAGAAIQAMRDLGLRHVVSLTITDKNYEETIPLGETHSTLDDEIKRMSASEAKSTTAWLDECEAFIETFHAPEKLTTACPGPSAVQRCTDELLTGAAEIARKKNLPMHIHLAETKAQAVMGKQLYATSLLQHLGSIGVLRPNLSLAHSIWIEPTDIELFAKSGATPVHNPASNLRIGSGLAPVKQFISAGVTVALGTDGAASNDGQNMFDALRLVALIHNQAGTDFNEWIVPAQALAMATRNGARAFGLDAGVLAPGKLADLVLLRRDTPAFTPLNDVMGQLVFCENGSSVDTVIVNGEVVVESGRLTKVDEPEVLRLAEQARTRLDPSIQRELQAARTLEPALAEMYFRVFGKRQ